MRIKKLNEVDDVALKLMADCGNARTETLISIGLSQTRLENYKRDGLLRPISCDSKYAHKDKEVVWGITEKGRAFIKENYGLASASSVSSVKHNSKVAEIYAEVLSNGASVDRIYSERDARILIEERLESLEKDSLDYIYWNDRYKNKELSMPDFTYVSEDGEISCYEVVTGNYSEAEISAKEITAAFLTAAYHQTDI